MSCCNACVYWVVVKTLSISKGQLGIAIAFLKVKRNKCKGYKHDVMFYLPNVASPCKMFASRTFKLIK